jgi:hypothetical protein
MTWLISIFLNMNLNISFSIFKVHLDAKQFTWKLKISFREDFSFKICNGYDARSKQNGLIMIYRIYLKSFMIFNHL